VNWRTVTLGDIVEVTKGISYKGAGLNQPGPAIVGLGEFQPGGGIKLESIRTYGGQYKERHVAQPGDLLIALTDVTQTGAVLGSPLVIPETLGPKCIFTHHVGRLTSRAKNEVDTSFLYYRLRAPDFAAFTWGYATGTTVRALRPQEACLFELRLPPLVEQREIAAVLGSLDDKIELNERMNATFDEMARALFKSWFVAFDPVRAKAEGRQPSHMDAATAALFPDSFEDSPLGPIPAGWHTEAIGDAIELAYGKALKGADRRPGSVIVMGSNGPVGNHDVALCYGPGIVVGRKGNPGFVTWISSDFFPIDTTFYVVARRGALSLEYLYHTLRTQDLPRLAADSAVPGVNRNAIYGEPLFIPSDQLIRAFTDAIRPMWQLSSQYEQESRTLAELRDSLLPRLISGEIRVGEVEREVEAAV